MEDLGDEVNDLDLLVDLSKEALNYHDQLCEERYDSNELNKRL